MEKKLYKLTKKQIRYSKVKDIIDRTAGVVGTVLLNPVFLGIVIAIKKEEGIKAPVFFKQKRVGKDQKLFNLYKFRTMKLSTPKDTPTHLLSNPEQYITSTGKFLRRSSLDELPQFLNIIKGDMAISGPRPALWNQDDLIAEREAYGVHQIKPGLTGWAQIHGRDELEIPVKAKLDAYYLQHFGLWIDIKCFFGTILSVLKSDGVVEGGTGEINKKNRNFSKKVSNQYLVGNIGFGEVVNPDFTKHLKVLVTGKGSYIGESFVKYANDNYKNNFQISFLDMLDKNWKLHDFSNYDIVYHVAGLAHADVGNVSDEVKEKYYQVNTDLAIEVCQKAKDDGVKEFVFMSSMIIYGESSFSKKAKEITENTIPAPANFYGDSKLQADVAVRLLANDKFKVIVLRPPMIYGKNSKGNYKTLSNLSRRVPVFPKVSNQRSMLYIENLCEFLCQLFLVDVHYDSVVLFPQNEEVSQTWKLVQYIRAANNKRTWLLSGLSPFVLIGSKIPGKIGGLVKKVFGNSCYSKSLSNYPGINYHRYSLKESVERTEK